MDYHGDDPLIHYGVLGMKWGVRKDGKPQGFQYGKAGTASKTARRARKLWKKARGTDYTPSEDHSRSRELSKKRLAEMSNQEIRDFNDRIRLEQEYSRLTSSGEKKLVPVLKKIGGNILPVAYNIGKGTLDSKLRENGQERTADFLNEHGNMIVQNISQNLKSSGGKKKKK